MCHTALHLREAVVTRKQLNTAVPMLYGIAIVVTVLLFKGALVGVAVVGAMLVGLYYAVWGRGGVEGGRERNRERNRNR